MNITEALKAHNMLTITDVKTGRKMYWSFLFEFWRVTDHTGILIETTDEKEAIKHLTKEQ